MLVNFSQPFFFILTQSISGKSCFVSTSKYVISLSLVLFPPTPNFSFRTVRERQWGIKYLEELQEGPVVKREGGCGLLS